MAQSHAAMLTHLIFSTKNRISILKPEIRSELFRYLAGIAKGEESLAHAIGGVEDHVHLLVTLPRTKSLACLVEKLKTGSSKWLKTKADFLKEFSWQQGYAAFSVSHSQIKPVCQYIRNQEKHHRRMDFQDELRIVLKRHELKFDERYLWG